MRGGLLIFLFFFFLHGESQNLLQNGGFEAGLTSWIPLAIAPGTSASIDSNTPFQGLNCFTVTGNNDTLSVNSGVMQQLTINPGGFYEFSYSLKTDSVNYLAFPYLKFQNGSNIFGIPILSQEGTQNWRQYKSRFQAPPIGDTLTVFFFLSGQKGSLSIDNVSLVELTTPNTLNFSVDFSLVIDTFNVNLLGTNAPPVWQGGLIDLTIPFQEIGIQQVRTHGTYNTCCSWHLIFPDTSANPLDATAYDFTATDQVIQSIINAGAEPFFRLGEPFEVNPTHNSPPINMDKWAQVCLQIVKHYNNGWNNGFNYNIKYWELWNEPDLGMFWNGSPQQFYALYKKVAPLLKSYDSTLHIGTAGFATLSDVFLKPFLDSVSTNATPMDFLSFHSYNYVNPYFFEVLEKNASNLLYTYGLSGKELFLSEWNNYAYDASSTIDFAYDDATSAAMTASSFYYLQKSNLTGAHRYRTDELYFGMFHDDGTYAYSGQTFRAMGSFRLENQLLQTNGSDTLGTICFAGKSLDNNHFSVVVSNPAKVSNAYVLQIQNITAIYAYEIIRIDANNNFIQVGTGTISPFNDTISLTISPPYVDLIHFTEILNVQEFTTQTPSFVVYPNPAKEFITISSLSDDKLQSVSIFNPLGKLIFQSREINSYNYKIAVDNWQKGIYFVQFKGQNKQGNSKLIIH